MKGKDKRFFRIIRSNVGFTLIELIVFVIIGAIFLPASMIALTKVLYNFWTPDYYVKSRFYAEQKMEEVTMNSFDNLTCRLDNSGVTSYTDYPDTNCSRACTINYVTNTSGTIADYGSSSNYKKVTISVTPFGGEAYIVYTLVSKRPK